MDVQVKSYKRRTKSGKVITVKGHTRKGVIGFKEANFRGYGTRENDGREYLNRLFGKKRGNEIYQAQQSRNKQQEQYDRLVDAATNSRYSKMRYRDAVKAGAPKLAPLFGEHISKRMNYGTALKKSYISGKGKRAKRIAKGL